MATNKFEEMLEHLVNEDREKAEELFHEIVVEKSRKIYEDLLAEETNDEEVDEASKDEDLLHSSLLFKKVYLSKNHMRSLYNMIAVSFKTKVFRV